MPCCRNLQRIAERARSPRNGIAGQSAAGPSSGTGPHSTRLAIELHRSGLEFIVPMKMVHKTVEHRREEKCCCDNKNEPSVECIQPSKQLPQRSLRCVHRTHAAQKHLCVEKSVNPGKMLEEHIPRHSEPQ